MRPQEMMLECKTNLTVVARSCLDESQISPPHLASNTAAPTVFGDEIGAPLSYRYKRSVF